MLFLALPPADMLPPAGHRARPGRSRGPHRPLRTARRAPRTLPRSGAAAAEGQAALQSSSNSSSASPAPPRAAGPSAGARDREAGLAPAWKVSAGKILAWSRRGDAARECPVPPEGPQVYHIPDAQSTDSTSSLEYPGHPVPPQVQWCMYIYTHAKARHVNLESQGGGLMTELKHGQA